MDKFENDSFYYKGNKLYCEGVAMDSLAEKFGTPLYVYSRHFFESRFKEFTNAFSEVNHKIFFAVKSNFNINVIKIFYNLGAGLDVNSAGEFYRAVKAGGNPQEMILTGVGKTAEEIQLGLKENVMMIKAESFDEVVLINEIAGKLGKVAPLAIRVNPDVDAETHPYISTGLSENKFGINSADAFDAFKEASRMKNVRPTGIDMHIGSQITSVSPYVEAVEKLAGDFFKLKAEGIELEHFDIGGGMGVRYKDEEPFTPAELANALMPTLKKLNCQIMFEPGRFLTANGGALITKVLYNKSNGNKHFVIVDAAMNDLLRPSIYKAYHHVQPVIIEDSDIHVADVVGPVCESGDYIAKQREIPKVEDGKLLAVMSAGAYGMVMASNYNGRRRPAEILVDGENFYVIRPRETYEHLLYDEKLVIE
jgi:diaminopimelate decarboxylase